MIILKNEADRQVFYQVYADDDHKIVVGKGSIYTNDTVQFDRRYLKIIYFVERGPDYGKGNFATLKSGYKYRIVFTHSKNKLILLSN